MEWDPPSSPLATLLQTVTYLDSWWSRAAPSGYKQQRGYIGIVVSYVCSVSSEIYLPKKANGILIWAAEFDTMTAKISAFKLYDNYC